MNYRIEVIERYLLCKIIMIAPSLQVNLILLVFTFVCLLHRCHTNKTRKGF